MSILANKKGSFILENSLFRRELQVDEYGLRTISILNLCNSREYVKRPDAAEFQVTLNNKLTYSYHKPEYHILDGNLTTSDAVYQFSDSEIISTAYGSEVLKLAFNITNINASVKVCYEIYPEIQGTTKWLEFTCESDELHISQLFFEILNTCPGEFVDSEFYLKHGTVRSQPMFAACGDEDIVQLHNSKLNEGLYLGNSAPGPMRYFMVYPHWTSGISCGYNMSSADFNIYLQPGETFVSDKALLMLYAGVQDDQAVRNKFRSMIRCNLPITNDKGYPMYCTWLPFLKNINETLLLDMVERAAQLGFKYFVIDDGWFTDDSWAVDKEKFPNGLKIIAYKIKALGMKFGLWYNIGNDYGAPDSSPENNALNFHSQPKRLGFQGKYTCRCMASAHRDFIIDKLSELTKKYDVDYFKLDFSSVLSPYGMTPYGCHSTKHAYHRDYSDSTAAQYRSMTYFKNCLKQRYPELVIDFSFETLGTESPSIGALMLSELHHITNMNTRHPEIVDALRIRNTVYNFSTLLPIERILGSLICLDGKHGLENFLSSFTGTPLVAGDLREISEQDLVAISAVAKAWEKVNKTDSLTEFLRLHGNRYVSREEWDGFARFNSDGNGMLFLFRNSYTNDDINLQFDCGNNLLNFSDPYDCQLGTYSAQELKAGITVDWLKNCDCRTVIFQS